MLHRNQLLSEYDSVKVWLGGYAKQWGAHPEEDAARLRVLAAFCTFVGKAPDAIIAECLRQVEEGQKIRARARRSYIETIKEFEAQPGGSRTQGNIVRSFFIHNGVAMSADILR